jgi:hypothetical protein
MKMLEDKTDETSIVTFNAFSGDWTQAYDVTKQDDGSFVWGTADWHQQVLSAKLVEPKHFPLAIVQRSFIRKWTLTIAVNGKKMLMPHKQIRMYVIRISTTGYLIEKLSPEDAFSCMNTDAVTGDCLPMDRTLEYV